MEKPQLLGDQQAGHSAVGKPVRMIASSLPWPRPRTLEQPAQDHQVEAGAGRDPACTSYADARAVWWAEVLLWRGRSAVNAASIGDKPSVKATELLIILPREVGLETTGKYL